MTYIISTHQLTKSYRRNEIVSNLNINVKKGEIYGLIGPNGAGKTTVMKMIMNLVKPSSGEVKVFGQKLTSSSYDLFKKIGAIIEYPILYEELTAKENLEIHCNYMRYHENNAIMKALKWVNLENIDNKPVKDFSLGMKQRLGIARAIITKPELLILDEPMNGLDPEGIRDIRNLLVDLSKQEGMTILISSHILGEIEQIADIVGVISEGQLMKEVPMESIRNKQTNYLELHTPQVSKAAFILEHQLKITNFQANEEEQNLKIYDMSVSQNEILKMMINNEVMIDAFSRNQTSLEDYFMQLIHGG